MIGYSRRCFKKGKDDQHFNWFTDVKGHCWTTEASANNASPRRIRGLVCKQKCKISADGVVLSILSVLYFQGGPKLCLRRIVWYWSRNFRTGISNFRNLLWYASFWLTSGGKDCSAQTMLVTVDTGQSALTLWWICSFLLELQKNNLSW